MEPKVAEKKTVEKVKADVEMVDEEEEDLGIVRGRKRAVTSAEKPKSPSKSPKKEPASKLAGKKRTFKEMSKEKPKGKKGKSKGFDIDESDDSVFSEGEFSDSEDDYSESSDCDLLNDGSDSELDIHEDDLIDAV